MNPLELLSFPGEVVRGALAGRPGELVSGQELTGDPFSGFLADIASDPLTWLSLGGAGVLSRMAKAKKMVPRGMNPLDDLVGAAESEIIPESATAFVPKSPPTFEPKYIYPRAATDPFFKASQVEYQPAQDILEELAALREVGYNIEPLQWGSYYKPPSKFWHTTKGRLGQGPLTHYGDSTGTYGISRMMRLHETDPELWHLSRANEPYYDPTQQHYSEAVVPEYKTMNEAKDAAMRHLIKLVKEGASFDLYG